VLTYVLFLRMRAERSSRQRRLLREIAGLERRRRQWEPHGMECNVCVDVATQAMQISSGASVDIRAAVEQKWAAQSQQMHTHTPTPDPPK
jgi:hypothetical protein